MCNCGKNRIVAPAGGRGVPVAARGAVSVAAPAASRQVVSTPPPAAAVSTRTVRRLPRTVVKSAAPPAPAIVTRVIPNNVAAMMKMAAVPSAPPPAPVVSVARATQMVTPVSKPPMPQKAIVAVRNLPPRRHKQILPPTRNKHGASRPAAATAATVDDGIIDPVIWGPSLWKVLHTLVVKAAGDASWQTVLDALRSALPCPECSLHYNTWSERFPVTKSIDVGEWLRNLHNDVNRRTRRQPWTAAMISDTYYKVTSLDEAMVMLNGKLGESAYKLLAAMVARVMTVEAPATLEVTELPEAPAAVVEVAPEVSVPVVEEVSVPVTVEEVSAPVVEETNTEVSVPVAVVEESAPVVEETNTEVSVPVEVEEVAVVEVVAPEVVEAPAVVAEIPEVSVPVEVPAPVVEEIPEVSVPVTVEEVAVVAETNTEVSVPVTVEEVAVVAEIPEVSVAAAMD